MRNLFLLTATGLLLCTILPAQQKPISVTDSISDNAIVYPESMTEQLSDLLKAWQLDLNDVDTECERGKNVHFHDSIYTRRLHSMPTVMELSYNSVVKKYIEMYADRKREQVSYMLALGDYYFPMFEQALDKHGLPLELKYLPVIESALNPVAISRAGATGLWQFMLRTGKGYGLEVNSLVDERRDPSKSTEAAARYLKDLYAIYGDWNLVIAAYNCGPGNVNKAIARSGGKRDYWQIYNRLPRETRGYVPAFIAANYIMSHYADHNICPAHPYNTNLALDTVEVNERIHLEQIARVLEISVHDLRRLNPQFKSDVIPGDFKAYSLVLPTEKMYAFIDKGTEITNFQRSRYFTHRSNTDGYLDGYVSSASGNGINVYYRVKKGDNLSSIARKNGISLTQLKSWNGLRSNLIGVGKRLIVGRREIVETVKENEEQMAQTAVGVQPDTVETVNQYYRVRKGDTLGKIASKNGVNVSQLQSWNKLKSTRIGVGNRLIVGVKEVAKPTPQPAEKSVEYSRANTSSDGGSNIISSYLKAQIENSAARPSPDEAGDQPEKE